MSQGPPPAALPGIVERLAEKVTWFTGFFKRFQWFRPAYDGSVTVRVLTGDTSGGSGPQQGNMTYSNLYRTAIDIAQNADYLTDINVWSRGSVSTAGVITPNTTSILIEGGAGSQPIILAPGESVTFRKKAPFRMYIKAGAAPAAADSVVIFW